MATSVLAIIVKILHTSTDEMGGNEMLYFEGMKYFEGTKCCISRGRNNIFRGNVIIYFEGIKYCISREPNVVF